MNDLAVERGGRTILAGISFVVPQGTALAITGPNGAGKSTLLRGLAGLIPIAAGQVRLGLDTGSEAIEARTHYLGHTDGLKRSLTALDNLRFAAAWGGTSGLPPTEALSRMGIPHVAELPASFLSAGQRRRIALARLLVAHRTLWLIDEPTTALDHTGETIFGAVMQDHLARGGIILAATHAPMPIKARNLQIRAA